jgi:hypothetical protein
MHTVSPAATLHVVLERNPWVPNGMCRALSLLSSRKTAALVLLLLLLL